MHPVGGIFVARSLSNHPSWLETSYELPLTVTADWEHASASTMPLSISRTGCIYKSRKAVLVLIARLLNKSQFLSRILFTFMRVHRLFTIAYIAKDDIDLLKVIDTYYRAIGVKIQFFMDDQSTPASLEELQKSGIHFSLVTNRKNYVEPLYAEVAKQVSTDWLLIATSDELLNPAAIAEAWWRVHKGTSASCFGISRTWVIEQEERLYGGAADFIGPDFQFRLIEQANVTFHDKIHTPGFDARGQTEYLDPLCQLYHFDWVVRSVEARRAKLAFYEQEMPGATDRYSRWYLPEMYLDEYTFEPLKGSCVGKFGKGFMDVTRR